MKSTVYKLKWLAFSILGLLARSVLAAPPIITNIPNPPPLTAQGVVNTTYNISAFLYTLAGVIAGITLIWSGFTYLAAGADTAKVAKAKTIFKNGLLGAVIVFAIGVIINTIRLIAADPELYFL